MPTHGGVQPAGFRHRKRDTGTDSARRPRNKRAPAGEQVEPTGHESLVFLQRGETRLVARVGADHAVKALESIPFALRLDRVHLFDKATERRVESDVCA